MLRLREKKEGRRRSLGFLSFLVFKNEGKSIRAFLIYAITTTHVKRSQQQTLLLSQQSADRSSVNISNVLPLIPVLSGSMNVFKTLPSSTIKAYLLLLGPPNIAVPSKAKSNAFVSFKAGSAKNRIPASLLPCKDSPHACV